jgi:hypothetical protein
MFSSFQNFDLILEFRQPCICKASARAETPIIVSNGCNRKKRPTQLLAGQLGNFQELWITLKILRLFNLWSTTPMAVRVRKTNRKIANDPIVFDPMLLSLSTVQLRTQVSMGGQLVAKKD